MTKSRITLLLLLLAIPAGAAGVLAEEYYAQEKCSICHIRESVFFDPKFAGPDRLGEFDEARMCGSCHNGSVRDARSVLWRGAQHPAPGGRGGRKCSSCHSPHTKGGWNVLAGSGVSLSGGGDAVCAGCHKAFGSRSGPIHRARFPAGGCRECHRAHGGTGKALLREGKTALCLRCHQRQDAAQAGGHPVAGASAGAAEKRPLPDCTGCHAVHGEALAGAAAVARCRGCHPAKAAKNARPHAGQEDCLACHAFHARTASGGRGFRGSDMQLDALCGRCHDAQRASTAKAGREKGTHVTQAPDGRDLCFRCHRIHGGAPGTALLTTSKAYFCLGCHPDQNTIRETGDLVLAHPVFERVQKGRLADAVRLKKVVLGSAGEIVCATCHKVHRAAPWSPLLAAGSEKSRSCAWCHEGTGEMAHSAGSDPKKSVGCESCHPVHGRRKTADDPWRGVCIECHPRASFHVLGADDRTPGRPKDLPLFDRKGRRTAVGSISCPTCHQPHGRMTAEKRLHRRYDSSAFLCTACHPKGESIALTPHDLRGIAGKSLCEPCHLPHGGTAELMWGVAKGGTAAGGDTCGSCHGQQGMATPVAAAGHPVSLVVARGLPPGLPLLREAGGTAAIMNCSTCHDVHGTGLLLFGQGTGKLLRPALRAGEGPGQGGDPCLPCHAGKQVSHGAARCAQCHPPHGPARAAEGCAECHKIRDVGEAARHARTGTGCGACHKVHAKARGEAQAACGGCHANAAKVAGTPHGELDGGVCGACHPAHGQPDNVIIKRRAWEETVLAADLACLRCHREGGDAPAPKWTEHPRSRKTVSTNYGATVVIESTITMASNLKEGGRFTFPLYDEAGRAAAAGRSGCLTCHDPHAAGSSGDGAAGGRTRYLRDSSGAFLSSICAACHRGDAEEHARKFHTMPRKSE